MADWPSGVPTSVLQDGYEETPPDATIRSSMDVGPAKLRRRSTSIPRVISCQQILTPAQVETIDAFYVTTLAHGSLPFNWTHPRSGTSCVMRWLSPPRYAALSNSPNYTALYQLEILP